MNEGLCFTHPKRADRGMRMDAMSQFRVVHNRFGNMYIYCRDVPRFGEMRERCVCLRQWNRNTGAWV